MTNIQNQGLGDFARQGFTLKRPDDHILELHHKGELVARFSQSGATRDGIQAECVRHLVTKHGRRDKGHA